MGLDLVGSGKRTVHRGQKQPGGARFVEQFQVAVLAGLVNVAVGEQQVEPGLGSGGFCTPGDVDEEGVTNVDQDQATVFVVPARRLRAALLRTNPRSAIAASTLWRLASVTVSGRLSTLDTVPRETPARSATSVMRGGLARPSRRCSTAAGLMCWSTTRLALVMARA
jgi:hypothetical protein